MMIEQWYYLLALIISLAGLATLDWRYKLALWYDRRRTLLTVGIGLGIFLLWDIAGIALGIFQHGGSHYSLPFQLGPEFPVEELFFLTLLCYNALLLLRAGEKLWSRT